MKNLFIITLIVLLGIEAHSQKLPLYLSRDTSRFSLPLFIVKTPDKKTIISSDPAVLIALDVNDIMNVNISKDSSYIKLYGMKARFGVLIVTCRDNVDMPTPPSINIAILLDRCKISTANEKLPVYVDSAWVKHPDQAYINPDEIKSVKIEKENLTDIKYIDIITNNPPPKLKPGETYIKGLSSL